MSQLVKALERNGERLRDVPGDVVTRREVRYLSMKVKALRREIG